MGWTDKLVYLVSVNGGYVRVCERVFSVGFGPGLESMSLARSRRSASHAAGTHSCLPKKLVAVPPERRDRWVQFAQLTPPPPPTVAHQPHGGCIRLVLHHMVTTSIRHKHQQTTHNTNTALRIASGCTTDTNTQHLHDETHILPIKEHLQLHYITTQQTTPRHKKQTFTQTPTP